MTRKKSSGNKGTGNGSRKVFTRVKTARGRKGSSTRWLQRQLNDPYVLKAKEEGYRSRAAYKLIEINEKFDLIKQDTKIVDLGAAPGGWAQVAVALTQSNAQKPNVIGIDLQEIEDIAGATFIQCDFLSEEADRLLEDALDGSKADLVLSDMAAASTGHSSTDHLRIIGLCEAAFEFSKQNLKDGGAFVAKILQGGTEHELLVDLKRSFKTVKHFKPPSSRSDSSESYVIGLGFRSHKETD